MTGLVATHRYGGHDWRIYDDTHRACVACGLRLFRHAVRGWLLLSFNGVPSQMPLLGSRFDPGAFGACSPPAAGELVFIEYTGDPDKHPGCERIMHRVPPSLVPREEDALSAVASMVPPCRVLADFWEVGPARSWSGWNWCQECFPGREPRHRAPSSEPPPQDWRKKARKLDKPSPHLLPAKPKALPAKKQQKPRKK
jgi:hypothetical protein